METRFYNDLSLHGSLVMTQNVTEFPLNPAIGTMIIKDQCLYAYIVIGGMETWYPFSTRTNSYIYTQGVPSSSWTINHNLGSTDVWYQVRDSNDALVIVGSTIIDEDTIRLDFTQAIAGTAVVVAPDSINVPQIKASEIHVASDTVIIDSSGVRINGSYALTSANISSQIDAAVAAETTARIAADATLESNLTALINAEATARQATDSSQGLLISNETAARVSADTTLRNDLNAEITARTTAVAGVQTSVDAESAARIAADATLTADLLTEVTARTSAITSLQSALNVETTARTAADALKEDKANKGVANGYASLDSNGKVPSAQLPSYVDDVLESANLAAFPATGASGIIYVAQDTNKVYRWSGSAYVEISPSEVNSVNGKTGNVYLGPGDIGIYIGTNVQAHSADLDAIANINDMQTGLLYKSGPDSYSTIPTNSFLMDNAPIGSIDILNVTEIRTLESALSSDTISVNSVAPELLDSFGEWDSRSAKYLIQISQGSSYQVSELLVIHTGTAAFMTEYAVLETNGSLATFTTTSNFGTVNLYATMNSSDMATIKLVKTAIRS